MNLALGIALEYVGQDDQIFTKGCQSADVVIRLESTNVQKLEEKERCGPPKPKR